MKKLNQNLSDIFNVEPVNTETEKVEVATEIVSVESNDVVDTDTEAARTNIKNLIQAGSKAVEELALVARDSQHPRAYEVMAGMLKNLSDMNKDLLEIQKKKKDIKEPPKGSLGSNNINVDKAVFVGSTAELIKQIKESK